MRRSAPGSGSVNSGSQRAGSEALLSRRIGIAIFLVALGVGAAVSAWWFGGAGREWYWGRLPTREIVLRALQDPGNARIQMLLGRRMEVARSWDAAADAYQHAAANPSTGAEAYAGLARVYMGMADVTLAARAAHRALTANPRSVSAIRAVADVAALQNNWLTARDRYQQLIKISAQDGEAWEGLAKANLELQRPDLAARELDRAGRILPPSPELFLLRGRADIDSGAPHDATLLLREATRSAPNNPQAWTYLGIAEMETGNAAFAEKAFRRAIALAPYAIPPASNLARLYEDEGRSVDAIKMYRRVLSLDANNEAALYHLSQILDGAGKIAEAQRLRQKFVRISDYHRTVVELQNRISRLLSEKSAARPELPDLYRRLGLLHLRNHNGVDAAAVLHRAVELLPGNPEVRDMYRMAQRQANTSDQTHSTAAGIP